MEWAGLPHRGASSAGFILTAGRVVAGKATPGAAVLPFLDPIERESHDECNLVKKAVNWALSTIGKRNRRLHKQARSVARRLARREPQDARQRARLKRSTADD